MDSYCDECHGKKSGGAPYYHIWKELDGVMYAVDLDNILQIPINDPGSAYLQLEIPPHQAGCHTLAGRTYCVTCMTRIDILLIEGLPLEDLPLYINQKWITEGGHQAFQRRIQTLSPSI